MTRPLHVGIIGAGISGLTAAHRLRQLLGPAAVITVIDRANQPGGKLHTVDFAGRRYDVGAEAFLARRPEVFALSSELGIADQIVHPSSVGATIRAGGRITALPSHTVLGIPASADAVRTTLSEAGARRVAEETQLPALTWSGDMAVGQLVRTRFGGEVVDRLVDPLLGGVYAGRADHLGVRATMPALASALDAGATSLSAAVAAVLPPSPSAPMTPGPVFGTMRTGLGTLVKRLAAVSAAQLVLDTAVQSVCPTDRGWRIQLEHNASMDVDGVLLAVPAPVAHGLLGISAPAALAEIEVASSMVVAMAFPASVTLPAASGVLIANDERHRDGTQFTAKALTYSSRKWTQLRQGADDVVVIRGSVGRHGDGLLLQDDSDVISAILRDVAELTGITARPVETLLTRWGDALPQYGVGHTDRVTAIEGTVSTLPGLAIAGAFLHGVGIPACIATARSAAEQLADYLADRHLAGDATMET